jgi:hypothetical protein
VRLGSTRQAHHGPGAAYSSADVGLRTAREHEELGICQGKHGTWDAAGSP